MRRVALLFVAVALLALTRGAHADPVPAVDVRTWAPSVDPDASLVLEPTSTPGPFTFSAASYLSFAHDSVVLRDPTTGGISAVPLQNELGLDVVLGLGLGERSHLAVRVPFTLEESGSTAILASLDSSGRVPSPAFGDIGFDFKETLIARGTGPFGLAALGELGVPSGAKTSFMSDRGDTLGARLLAEGGTTVFTVMGSLGYTVRTEHVDWPPNGPSAITFGNSIPWAVGVLVKPSFVRALDPGARQTWELALHGALPGGPVFPFGAGAHGSAALSSALLTVSDRVAFGHYRDTFVLAGLDVGLDDAIGVPDIRAIVAFGFRFASHDRDRDGIPDDRDQCPDLPEDRDGFQDEDGCPEADNDDDGIVDALDACPLVPGVPSPDPRQNGCPVPSPRRPPPSPPATPKPVHP